MAARPRLTAHRDGATQERGHQVVESFHVDAISVHAVGHKVGAVAALVLSVPRHVRVGGFEDQFPQRLKMPYQNISPSYPDPKGWNASFTPSLSGVKRVGHVHVEFNWLKVGRHNFRRDVGQIQDHRIGLCFWRRFRHGHSQWLNCHSSSEMASKTTGPVGSKDVNQVASTMAMFSTRTLPACSWRPRR